MIRLLHYRVDGVASLAALVAFVVTKSVVAHYTRRTPHGPLLHRISTLTRRHSPWLERVILGDIGCFLRLQFDVAQCSFVAEAREEKGEFAQPLFFLGSFPRVLLSNPADVKYMLLDAPELFRKDDTTLVLKPLLGRYGLITILDESFHAVQRNMISHAFGSAAVHGIAETTMRAHFANMIKVLRRDVGDAGHDCVLEVVFDQAALRIIGEAAFNTNAFDVLQNQLNRISRIIAMHPLLILGPTIFNALPLARKGLARETRSAIAKLLEPTLHRVTHQKTDDETIGRTPKMLAELLAETPILTPEMVLDHAVTFLFAGHDTTSTTLMWLCYYVAKYPRVQEALFEELSTAFTTDTTPTVALLKSLSYLEAVAFETLRIRPPVGAFWRTPVRDVVLPSTKTFVPAGTGLGVPVYALHRDPSVYGADSDQFRPERWIDDPLLMTRALPCNFIPFAAGKRACLGREFAMLEVKLGAAVMVRNFVLALHADDGEPLLDAQVLVKAKYPIRFKLTPRS